MISFGIKLAKRLVDVPQPQVCNRLPNGLPVGSLVGTPRSAPYDFFFSNFQRHYNESFTFVRSNKKNKNKKLWVSLNLLTKIRLKNKLYKRFCCNPTYENEDKYKKIRNKVSSELRKAKQMYFYQRFNDCRTDLNKTWKSIHFIN